MKIGDKVFWKDKSRTGTCLGPHFAYSVWWIKVQWEDETCSLVLESVLEVIDENR